jgi:YjbE family integral membrane protein
MEILFDAGAIIMADLILSGDNALIIGMAAAGLSPKLRARAILFGMVIAALLRIIFAVAATKLLAVPGLLFVGGLLLCWVCWRLYSEIRAGIDEQAEHALEAAEDLGEGYTGPPRRSLASALWTITLADVSMSLDNVLAVAAIADGNTQMLVLGLALAILLMAFAATLIMKLLTRFQWISWIGLAVLVYVAAEMLFRGVADAQYGIGPMLGLMEGMDLGKGH